MQISGPALTQVNEDDSMYADLLNAHKRLSEKDFTLWGSAAADEAKIRLNWVDFPLTSRDLIPGFLEIAERFKDLTTVILCGMGGSSLAPEVMARSYGCDLIIMDSTDPVFIDRIVPNNLSKTLVIISSKSGSTLETASLKSFFEKRLLSSNLNPKHQMIFITDPGSTLDRQARAADFTVVNADPNVGGRYSALSAFGLLPAALVGVNISQIVSDSKSALDSIIANPSPVIRTAAALLSQSDQYVALINSQSAHPGLPDWIEQLIAESTGKDFKGRLPIVVDNVWEAKNQLSIAFENSGADVEVVAPLGAQFVFWEWVTSLIGYGLGVDPFNQPNVTEGKDKTSALLDQWRHNPPEISPNSRVGAVEIFGDGSEIRTALLSLKNSMQPGGYISITAYLDRESDKDLEELRGVLSEKFDVPVTFGWGPRFLHSTGQFHKGGVPNGSFLQITSQLEDESDVAIPGSDFTFGSLISAQALGDGLALAQRSYPVLRLNLLNRENGIKEIIQAAKEL